MYYLNLVQDTLFTPTCIYQNIKSLGKKAKQFQLRLEIGLKITKRTVVQAKYLFLDSVSIVINHHIQINSKYQLHTEHIVSAPFHMTYLTCIK